MKTAKFVTKATTDYSIFKIPPFQRTRRTNVNNLKKSIQGNNLIEPIIVCPNGNVINGQHRLYAMMQLGEPVWYTVNNALNSPDKVAKAYIEANDTSTKISAKDAFDWASGMGLEDAREALSIAKRWTADYKGLSVNSALEVLKKGGYGNLKSSAIHMSYKLDKSNALRVMNFLSLIKSNEVFLKPFMAKFVRAVKQVNQTQGGLDLNAVPFMQKINIAKANSNNEKKIYQEVLKSYLNAKKEL